MPWQHRQGVDGGIIHSGETGIDLLLRKPGGFNAASNATPNQRVATSTSSNHGTQRQCCVPMSPCASRVKLPVWAYTVAAKRGNVPESIVVGAQRECQYRELRRR